MTAYEIMRYDGINETDADKVTELAASIRKNGWQGAPILVHEECCQIVTGSHRLAALQMLDREGELDLDELGEIAEPVDDIVDAWCDEHDCTMDRLPYDDLRYVFADTWVEEEYADQIDEW